MKSKITILLLMMALFPSLASSAIKFGEGDYSAELGGFVKTDLFLDTRNCVEMREGAISAIPLRKLMIGDNDINSVTKFNILPIETRLSLKINAPSILGVNVGAFVETEFFGSTDATINSIRMRHAYVDLSSGAHNLRVGQFWHPLNDWEVAPATVSPLTSILFSAGLRNPQLRYTFKANDEISLFAAIASQRDFTSVGPTGASSKYLRESGIPEIGCGIKYSSDNFGVSLNADYKVIKPMSSTFFNSNKVTQINNLGTYAASLAMRYKVDLLSFKGMLCYGQNLADFLNISGFGIKEMTMQNNEITEVSFTPFNQIISWLDISYGKEMQVGVFFGYNKNLGANDYKDALNYYSRYSTRRDIGGISIYDDVESMLKIAPRFVQNIGKYQWGVEVEMNTANWGIITSGKGNNFKDLESVTNFRVLASFTYFL